MASNKFSPSVAPCFEDCTKALNILESKLFEDMQVELDDPTLWEKLAAMNPGMTPRELEEQFNAVLAENNAIMAGLIPIPDYTNHLIRYNAKAVQQHAPSFAIESSMSNLIASLKQALPDRSTTKGVTWSDEEHRLFLLGMDLHGKGDWKSISKYFVLSRTPSQIASHAQKFFNRKLSCNNRRRASIHDLATACHLQHPVGYIQNMFNDRRINYLGQAQIPLLHNRYMTSTSFAGEPFEYNKM